MNPNVKVELRFNNAIFKCVLDEKYYNLKDTMAYAVTVAIGIIPQPSGPTVNLDPQIICEYCWEENKNEKGLQFKEPSPIVSATPDALQNLKRGIKN